MDITAPVLAYIQRCSLLTQAYSLTLTQAYSLTFYQSHDPSNLYSVLKGNTELFDRLYMSSTKLRQNLLGFL